MIAFEPFLDAELRGGFRITAIAFAEGSLVDPIGREALARTSISGNKFRLLLRRGLSDEELSVTLFHEVLEAATVAGRSCPAAVVDFNEGDFEREARVAHKHFGAASPENLNRMLQQFGF